MRRTYSFFLIGHCFELKTRRGPGPDRLLHELARQGWGYSYHSIPRGPDDTTSPPTLCHCQRTPGPRDGGERLGALLYDLGMIRIISAVVRSVPAAVRQL